MDFAEWLKQQEMVGTGAIYDGTKSKDFNWWGAPETAGRKAKDVGKPPGEEHKKKHKKGKDE